MAARMVTAHLSGRCAVTRVACLSRLPSRGSHELKRQLRHRVAAGTCGEPQRRLKVPPCWLPPLARHTPFWALF